MLKEEIQIAIDQGFFQWLPGSIPVIINTLSVARMRLTSTIPATALLKLSLKTTSPVLSLLASICVHSKQEVV